MVAWNIDRRQGFQFLLLLFYLALFLPFWKPVVLGFLFAAGCAPMLTWCRITLNARRSRLVAALMVLLILATIGIVAYLGVATVNFAYQLAENQDMVSQLADKASLLREQVAKWITSWGVSTPENINNQLTSLLNLGGRSIRDFLITSSRTFLAQTPEILLGLVVFVMAFGSFLMVGGKIGVEVSREIGAADPRSAYDRFERICSVSLGSIIGVGFFQAITVLIGALIAGQGSLFLIFLVTFICSLIPVVGAAAVPFVIGIFEYFNGDLSHAIILWVTAAVAGSVDNVLKAWLFSRAAKTNPVISLITLLGGLALFGFAGLFIAPVTEQLFMALVADRRARQ